MCVFGTSAQHLSQNKTGRFGEGGRNSGDIIGKYELDEIKPSIDTAAKIADALKVTLDFLVKDAQYENIDNVALKKLKLLEKLSPEDKSHIFALMDAFCKA